MRMGVRIVIEKYFRVSWIEKKSAAKTSVSFNSEARPMKLSIPVFSRVSRTVIANENHPGFRVAGFPTVVGAILFVAKVAFLGFALLAE